MSTEPHFHRCKQCGDQMRHGCIDKSCDEGFHWVILCIRCHERLVEAAERQVSW